MPERRARSPEPARRGLGRRTAAPGAPGPSRARGFHVPRPCLLMGVCVPRCGRRDREPPEVECDQVYLGDKRITSDEVDDLPAAQPITPMGLRGAGRAAWSVKTCRRLPTLWSNRRVVAEAVVLSDDSRVSRGIAPARLLIRGGSLRRRRSPRRAGDRRLWRSRWWRRSRRWSRRDGWD